MPQFLDTMKIPIAPDGKTAIDDLKWLAGTFMKQRIPVALDDEGVVGLHP
jgi:hypothetical protein